MEGYIEKIDARYIIFWLAQKFKIASGSKLLFMDNEIWKPVRLPIDLTSRYEISSEGRLKRLGYFTKQKKLFKPDLILSISKAGRYLKVSIKHKGSYHNISIHRLVCYAFHPNPENKPQVNHKNANKHDNRADNLEWATQSENIQHAQSLGILKYAKPKQPKKKQGRVAGFKGAYKKIIDTNTGKIYESVQELSKITGMHFKTLRRGLSGERYNRTPYRYFVKGVIQNDVKIPPPPKIKIEKPKFVRPPKKEYVPHPKPLKQVIMSDLNGKQIRIFQSAREACQFTSTKYETFRKAIKKGNNGFHKGYLFKFAS